MSHLENLVTKLENVKTEVDNWDSVLFAAFYHDIVYSVVKHNNEKKSAELAGKKMKLIFVPDEVIQKCSKLIMATQKHSMDNDSDVNFFTDADLSVLGEEWPVYLDYSQKIRKEYTIYPDQLYNSGRKKVLLHFLDMTFIFKTYHFRTMFENRARQNLQQELEILLT